MILLRRVVRFRLFQILSNTCGGDESVRRSVVATHDFSVDM